jgi:hypothetical protein
MFFGTSKRFKLSPNRVQALRRKRINEERRLRGLEPLEHNEHVGQEAEASNVATATVNYNYNNYTNNATNASNAANASNATNTINTITTTNATNTTSATHATYKPHTMVASSLANLSLDVSKSYASSSSKTNLLSTQLDTAMVSRSISFPKGSMNTNNVPSSMQQHRHVRQNLRSNRQKHSHQHMDFDRRMQGGF